MGKRARERHAKHTAKKVAKKEAHDAKKQRIGRRKAEKKQRIGHRKAERRERRREGLRQFGNTIKGVGNFFGKQIDKVTDIPKEAMDAAGHLGDNVEGSLNSLALPLAVGAAAIGAVMIMKK